MSTRGPDFLYKWISNNIPEATPSDILSVAELVQKLFADAKALGITSNELEQDTGSVYQVVLEPIVHQQGGA